MPVLCSPALERAATAGPPGSDPLPALAWTTAVESTLYITWLRERDDRGLSREWRYPIPGAASAVAEFAADALPGGLRRLHRCFLRGVNVDAAVRGRLVGILCDGRNPDSAAEAAALDKLAAGIAAEIPRALERAVRHAVAAGRTDPPRQRTELSIDVCLPPLDRAGWLRRAGILEGCQVAARADGGILVRRSDARPCDEDLLHHTALGMAAALDPAPGLSQGGPRCAWTDTRRLTPAQWRLLMPPLLEAAGLAGIPAPQRPVTVQWTLEAPAASAVAWLEVPKERTTAHSAVYTEVSRTVQHCLRRWLPYYILHHPEACANRDLACAVLVYGASRPFSHKRKAEFTYDPMNCAKVAASARDLYSVLPGRIEALRGCLFEVGCEAEASWWSPGRLESVRRRAACGNRHYLNLLAADQLSVGRFLRWGNEYRRRACEKKAAPERALQHVVRSAADIDQKFRIHFNRLSRWEDLVALGPLLHIEATAALNRALGREAERSLTLEVKDAGGVDVSMVRL